MLSKIPRNNKKKFSKDFFGNITDSGLDLLKKLLQWHPEKRLTCDQALEHKYFKDFHCANEEIKM